jgi:transposase-like protein
MSDPRKELARQRAEIILQVRSGQITATEGARLLGISRKTYYQWEQRALAGMLSQLEDLPPGRPATPRDPEKVALQKKVTQLKKEFLITQQTAEIMALMEQREEEPTKKNSSSPNKS